MPDKWGRRLFIAGAVVVILLGLSHSLSLLGGPPPANATEQQLQDLMKNYRFNLMGSMRSMDNVFSGFSIAFIIAMIGLGALNLVLSRERTGLLKRMALINVLW